MTSISGSSLTACFVFDGDGKRIFSLVGDRRTLYVNAYFEVETTNNAKVYQNLKFEDVGIREKGIAYSYRWQLVISKPLARRMQFWHKDYYYRNHESG